MHNRLPWSRRRTGNIDGFQALLHPVQAAPSVKSEAAVGKMGDGAVPASALAAIRGMESLPFFAGAAGVNRYILILRFQLLPVKVDILPKGG